ncbi:SusC/RagA family TonB-linked outer membrane protein [Carboxylicivirga sp. A043]|uniref:SusC/RagA family TonB-linked outer membrane protein n=1 Tax=Carboxylicivirga litoralis TaxID=2816963 RepID=UPI0021CB73B5|nr:SusC/RagA family TonB-linked outer membrane protein [Carboxylicivirga sp. A043]MCU4154659.1 SusC/RagA family TonB-linked outer membrane protein [Carboxylicivirga sp. A043]
MKLIIILLVACGLNLSATVKGQKLDLKIKNGSLTDVLNAIEKQSDYRFAYSADFFEINREVSLNVQGKEVTEVLDELLEGTDYLYRLQGDFIVFIPKVKRETNRVIQNQSIIIKGIVTDTEGDPLPGVNVFEKGNSINGVITDYDGNYQISVSSSESTIVFSYIGFQSQEIIVASRTNINITLVEEATDLDEVVVTALGISKEKKRVGYAIQEVDGKAVQKAIAPNVIESMTGKVAGLTITNSNEFFSDPGIYLRGEKPLIVVDGVPVGTDMWNINSDDIEGFSVLKAAAASALYGSAGRDGAIQITTKSGAKGDKGTTVTVNSSNTFQTGFIRIPRAQTQYGPGDSGIYEYVDGKGGGKNDMDYVIWGPKFDGRLLPQYDSPIDPETGERIPTPWVARGKDNLGNFMETGVVSSTNVTVQTVGEKGSFTISDTYRYNKASVPGAKVNINTLRLRGLLNITDKLNMDASLQYNYQYADNMPRSNYGPHSPIYNMTIWGGAHYDIRNYRDYWKEGKEGVEQNWVESWRYNNPYLVAYEYNQPYEKNDILGFMKLNYKFNDKLDMFVRTHVNSYTTIQEREVPVDMYDYDVSDRGGRYSHTQRNRMVSNTDFLINYKDKFFDGAFDVQASFGGNQRINKYNYVYASTTQLVVPGVFKLSNSVDRVTPTSYKEKKGVYSLYAYADLGYKDFLFMNISGRVDKSSVLPEENSSFFYPSVSASGIVSNMVNLPNVISFLKVRGAYAKVGGDQIGNLGVYGAQNSYSTGSRIRNLPYATYPDNLENPDLEPSYNSSWEAGLEVKFFNNRLGFDASWYQNTYGPAIYSMEFSDAAGYTNMYLNGKKTRKTGIDLTIKATPVKKRDFNWDVLVNFDTYEETLLELPDLPDGTPQTAQGYVKIGESINDYWYKDWERTPTGELIIGANGLPVATDFYVNHGSSIPDFSLSMTNTFNYKNFNLSFLIDGRFGGVASDRYERDLWRSGSHPDAIHPERELSNIAYVYGGDAATMLIEGKKVIAGDVEYDGDGNIVSDTREYADNDVMVDYQRWAKNYMGDWKSNIIDKTFIKLREVTLTYNVPRQILNNTFLSAASVSFVGRNLFYWTKADTFGDMDTYSMGTVYTNLQLPSQRTYGFNINLAF